MNSNDGKSQNNEEAQIGANGRKDSELDNSISKLLIFACYITAFMLVVAILYGFLGIVADILNKTELLQVDRLIVVKYVGVVYFVWRLTKILGDHWRSSEKNEIGTAVTNFPNPFYDSNFTKGPILLRRKYRELLTQYNFNKSLLKRSQQNSIQLGEAIKKFDSKLRVLLRHNDNSNRLLRSVNYLYQTDDKRFVEKMLNHILEECITILEKDQSDKSISLFEVNKDKLSIKESVRINAESIAKRYFNKNEGFAGYIWGKDKAEIVNHIKESDKRFLDGGMPATPIGSILGFPLMVDENIIGVLCLQSESENGFNEADLRTVEFYARMCTFILLYDKMNINDMAVEGGENE
ncbi:GAF domain-containing protein [Neobacillus niacini]|uniref:GAF domain-containing protein n=1 Tax=Neobacillus niacini TaxID=86668 RepID=UPI001C8E791D|nr:GAF domain-containing protein [Neobacillus niacini]MBY0145073.1 GAF domain-containing protein [Neobacillus niacini]